MASITGTFTGEGNSTEIGGQIIHIDMTFAGTATVNVQWKLDGTNWRTIDSYTASGQINVEAGGNPVRLNCSAHTHNVTYAMVASNA